MARHRRQGSRNWARGLFATFWILLGGLSGAYLFTAFTNPAALGGQLVALDAGREVNPAGDGTTAAISTKSSDASEQEIAEINQRLRQLTDQVASLNARFKPIEKVVGPVDALPPAVSVTTSMPGGQPTTPATETKPPEAAAAPPPAPAAPPAEEAKPAPAAPPKAAEAPKDEAKAVQQAAVEPAEEIKPAPAPASASEPPPVAVSPLEEDAPEEAAEPEPEPAADAASPSAPVPVEETPAPAPPPATESAALDPVALPPAANDGSTRYGIEIGTVAKQDALRPLWREFLTKHAALVAGLQPRRVLAPDKKWRLIAGPFGSADEASQACALFKKALQPCEATVYAGDSL